MKNYRKGPRNLTVFCAAAACNDTGEEMIRPFLPYFAITFLSASPFLFGLIMAVEEAANRTFRFFTGAVSDIIGRKAPVAGGYLCIVSYRIGTAFSIVWHNLLLFVTLRQFGRALRDPAREATITECFSPKKRGRAFGVLNMVDTIGAIFGPLLGLIILYYFTYGQLTIENMSLSAVFDDPLAYRKLFLLAAIPTLLSAFIIIFFLYETLQTPSKKHSFYHNIKTGWKLYCRNRTIMVYTFGNVVFALGAVPFLMIIGYVTAPQKNGGLGFSITEGAFLCIIYNVVLCLASLPAGSFVDRIGRKPAQLTADMLCIGYLLAVGTTAYLTFVKHEYIFTVLMLASVLYGIFEAFWITSRRAVIADLAPATARAQVLGTFSMMYGLSLLFAPFIFGFIWSVINIQTACFVASSFCGLAAIYLFIMSSETVSLRR